MVLCAFLLFFLIVGGELFLAVWLPWHLKLDRVWADHVARQELLDHFDGLRRLTRRAAEKLPAPAADEAGLILRSLDSNAAFLHKYGQKLSHSMPDVQRGFDETAHSICVFDRQRSLFRSGQT